MSYSILLISNNPCFQKQELPHWEFLCLTDSARAVLTACRDKIHLGWRLLHHPLYGNIQPKHQPYRTTILQKNTSASLTDSTSVDEASLALVESALHVYSRGEDMLPERYPAVHLHDCSYLDFALIETPLVQAGWSDLSTVKAFFKHS